MKIGTLDLLLIGASLVAYSLYKRNKETISRRKHDTPEGGSCMSSFGPGYYERNGKCVQCPENINMMPMTPEDRVIGPKFNEDGISIMYSKEHCQGITKVVS